MVTLRPILRGEWLDMVLWSERPLAGEFKHSEEFCDPESRCIKEYNAKQYIPEKDHNAFTLLLPSMVTGRTTTQKLYSTQRE